MKYKSFPTVLMLFFFTQLPAQNISLTDFLIPESRYQYLFGNLNGTYNNGRNSGSSTSHEGQSGWYSLQFTSLSGYNSEHESYSADGSLGGTYRHNDVQSEYDWTTLPRLYEQTSRYESSDFYGSGQYSYYLTPDETYAYGRVLLSGEYWLSRSRTDTNNALERLYFEKQRRINGSVGGGIGYGKMREASSVFAVVRIIEKLTEDGYLVRELSKEEILDLVNTYARKTEYTASYDRPIKYLLEDLFKKLQSMGVLKEHRATAYEVLRVEEVLGEFIFPRMTGWIVQAGIAVGRRQERSSRSEQYYNPWEFIKSERNDITVQAKYGYPFSLSLHFYADASASIPVYGRQNRVGYSAATSLYYQIGERISNNATISYQKQNEFQGGNSITDTYSFSQSVTISNTARYFIENDISFSCTVRYSDWININEYPTGLSRYTSGGLDISFGLNYRFY